MCKWGAMIDFKTRESTLAMKSLGNHIVVSALKASAQRSWKRVAGLSAAALFAGIAHGAVLTSGTFTISSGAGQSGSGAGTSCMVMSDGSTWSGGAVGVQGAGSMSDLGSDAVAANSLFKFSIGSFVTGLNNTYGVGNWTVSNIQLTLQYTLYANNSRFGAGAGTFDIEWVANDSWVQGSVNPPYVTSASGLSSWSGGQALVGSENYTWTTPAYTGSNGDLAVPGVWVTDKTGPKQSTISYSLDSDPAFVADITSASAASDPAVSLDLIATSPTMGMTIFTGGGSTLPTLTFDVVTQSVPEPASYAYMLVGLGGLTLLRFRRR